MSSVSIDAYEGAVFLQPYRAVYVEVPKVACSSIKLALAEMLGLDVTAVGGNPHKLTFPVPPSRPKVPGSLYSSMFSFAFVRSPWDRLVSCYRDKILGEAPDFTGFDPKRGVAHCLARFDVFKAGMPFERFVEAIAGIPDESADPHFRSQHSFITDEHGEIGVDFVGKFESLTSDWLAVCEQIGLPSHALPRVQAVSTPRRYVEYYNPTMQKVVQNRYREDIELFGYEFGNE